MTTSFREYVGVISHDDFVAERDLFEDEIKVRALQEMHSLGYVVRDYMTEWIKKPSFIDNDTEWACRVTCIVTDSLEEELHG